MAMEPVAENDHSNLEETLAPAANFIQLQSHELVAKAPFILANPQQPAGVQLALDIN